MFQDLAGNRHKVDTRFSLARIAGRRLIARPGASGRNRGRYRTGRDADATSLQKVANHVVKRRAHRDTVVKLLDAPVQETERVLLYPYGPPDPDQEANGASAPGQQGLCGFRLEEEHVIACEEMPVGDGRNTLTPSNTDGHQTDG